uniref:Unkown protein n=1 Tax=Riptortus pedestris TaxID=329032 RepID=R4WTK8_RIPPE|nr:unkown protein [Riptortus pedestris]
MIDNETNFPPELEVTSDGYPSPGARNQRHIAAICRNSNSSSFEQIHGLAEYIMCKLNIPVRSNCSNDATTTASQKGDMYSFEPSSDGAYFPGRALDVMLWRAGKPVRIGSLGVIHPNTLKAYDIATPCSFVELNIQFACTT